MTNLAEVQELARLQAQMAADASWEQELQEVLAFLVNSENDTRALIAYLRNPRVVPRPPAGGDIEFGFVLYWIHNPPPEICKYLDDHWLLKFVYDLVAGLAPPTRITTPEYDAIEADFSGYGEPGPDGTMYGRKKYQQLDRGWMLSFLNYVVNVIDPGSIKPLPDGPTATIALHAKDRNVNKGVVLGIVGDWGTGYYSDEGGVNCPAQRVIEQITGRGQSPVIDYLIHLGDVYYAGTDLRPLPGEEQQNFCSLWPDQGAGRNFTLNSNHEMYGAASGYFDVTLRDGKFAAQKGMSRFALTYGAWLVLGLDSAYYSDAFNGRKMYMDGAIGAPGFDEQIGWVAQYKNWPGPVMIMTHHGAVDTLTAQVQPMFAQVAAALNRPPTLWYWGHVHNGIVYQNVFDITAVAPVPTKGRCCGHGAIPFGNAWGLQDANGKTLPNIAYYAHTPDIRLPNTIGPDPENPRVRNGYALVTLHADGGFDEAFYETDIAGPVWQARWTAAQLGPKGAEL